MGEGGVTEEGSVGGIGGEVGVGDGHGCWIWAQKASLAFGWERRKRRELGGEAAIGLPVDEDFAV